MDAGWKIFVNHYYIICATNYEFYHGTEVKWWYETWSPLFSRRMHCASLTYIFYTVTRSESSHLKNQNASCCFTQQGLDRSPHGVRERSEECVDFIQSVLILCTTCICNNTHNMTNVIYELQHHALSLNLDPLFLLYSLLILLLHFMFFIQSTLLLLCLKMICAFRTAAWYHMYSTDATGDCNILK